MSSVLERGALEKSPLADLHLLAKELGVENFRRLRKADLIDTILARQSGEEPPAVEDGVTDEDEATPRRRSRRGGRGRQRDEDPGDEVAAEVAAEDSPAEEEDRGDDDRPARAPRGGRGRGGRERGERSDRAERGDRGGRDRDRDRDEGNGDREERTVEGVVELLGNGSGFVRVSPPESTDEDVYISAAQVKRCELVSGDRVGGPVRPPRRSERFASLIRIDTINDRPADEVAEGTRFDDLPVAFPSERIALGGEDPTVKAIEWLTPFGKGSRVVIAGPARAGKTEALRRLAAALSGIEGLEVSVVLSGVRPEEVAEWQSGELNVIGAQSFAASSDTQAATIEQAIEQGRRVASRGGDAVVLIDSLEFVSPAAARRSLASARNIIDGGSLTVIATAPAPVGGETTVIALDSALTGLGRFPALALLASGTMRPELLVGDAGAEAIAKARTEALG